MFLETFFLLLVVAVFLLAWGWKSQNPGIYFCGGLIIVALGIMLAASGLTTSNATNIVTTKAVVDGNTTYQTAMTFQNITIANSMELWIVSFVMTIVGMLGTLVGLTFLRKKG